MDLVLVDLEGRLADQGLLIQVSTAVKEKLAADGYDPLFGARPLKRAVEAQLENELAQKLIAGEFFKGDTVRVSVVDGQIVFHRGATELAPHSVNAVPATEPSRSD